MNLEKIFSLNVGQIREILAYASASDNFEDALEGVDLDYYFYQLNGYEDEYEDEAEDDDVYTADEDETEKFFFEEEEYHSPFEDIDLDDYEEDITDDQELDLAYKMADEICQGLYTIDVVRNMYKDRGTLVRKVEELLD